MLARSPWIALRSAVFASTMFIWTHPASAADAWIAYGTGTGDTFLSSFDTSTGKRNDQGSYLDPGNNRIAIEEFGGLAIAPDGTLWGAYEAGGGNIFLAAFDSATGTRSGTGAYLDAGNSRISIGDFAGFGFAPDGTAWAAYAAGNGDIFLGAFDFATGMRTGIGNYLDIGNSRLGLSDFGGIAFGLDGAAWIAYATGVDDTFLASFDPLTGKRTGSGAYLDPGNSRISINDFGGLAIDPEGTAWVSYAGGGGNSFLAAFDSVTGLRLGGGNYLDVGNSRLSIEDFGGIAFSPGSVTSAVPEPSTWAMTIAGMGAVGGAMRRRRSRSRTSLQR